MPEVQDTYHSGVNLPRDDRDRTVAESPQRNVQVSQGSSVPIRDCSSSGGAVIVDQEQFAITMADVSFFTPSAGFPVAVAGSTATQLVQPGSLQDFLDPASWVFDTGVDFLQGHCQTLAPDNAGHTPPPQALQLPGVGAKPLLPDTLVDYAEEYSWAPAQDSTIQQVRPAPSHAYQAPSDDNESWWPNFQLGFSNEHLQIHDTMPHIQPAHPQVFPSQSVESQTWFPDALVGSLEEYSQPPAAESTTAEVQAASLRPPLALSVNPNRGLDSTPTGYPYPEYPLLDINFGVDSWYPSAGQVCLFATPIFDAKSGLALNVSVLGHIQGSKCP
jgi:hypothetical protein